jgi:hypothetical protein
MSKYTPKAKGREARGQCHKSALKREGHLEDGYKDSTGVTERTCSLSSLVQPWGCSRKYVSSFKEVISSRQGN